MRFLKMTTALRIEIEKLEAEVVKLNDEIHKLTNTDDLHETEIKILIYLADENATHFRDSMAIHLNLAHVRLDYYLEALIKRKYITWIGSPEVGVATQYVLTQRGREFLFKNKLI